MLDLLKLAGDIGLPISSYRYVGMGANRFYDFIMFHKYLGIKDMVSLENDPSFFKRAEFNKPYNFVRVSLQSSSDFLSEDGFERSSIVWFDYDDGLGPEMTSDIENLGLKAKVGDFCFVTAPCLPPGFLSKLKMQERLAKINDVFGDYANGLTIDDMQDTNFAAAVSHVLLTAFKRSFAYRSEGSFVPILKVRYADGIPMATIGGAFLPERQASDIREAVVKSLEILKIESEELCRIKSFNLTERERVLFDLAATRKRKRSAERNRLRDLGFKDDDIEQYGHLLRYLPRYFETII
jgi:hypothetical protein